MAGGRRPKGLPQGDLGVVFAALAALFAYRSIREARTAIAEARSARREERLQRELARYERLMDIIKRMWVVINRRRRHPKVTRTSEEADELDGLLYELRASLATFTRDELPKCHRLAYEHTGDSMSGQPLVGNPPEDPGAEAEVKQAIDRARAQLGSLVE